MTISPRHFSWFTAGLLAIVVLVAFAPGLDTPFQYDDLSTVVENATIRNLADLRLALSPPVEETTSGRPVLNLSFAVTYALTGLNVVGYHATNVVLHLLCAWLVFAIVRRTAQQFPSALSARADLVAAATATIWAVHPLQTGAVTYISGRSELLMGFFYLATLFASIEAFVGSADRVGSGFSRTTDGVGSAFRLTWLIVAIAASALGMACKESMATVPVAVLLYDRAYFYDRFSAAFRERWRLYAGLAATWVILVPLVLQAPRSESAGFSTEISPLTYLLNQAVIIPEYFRLAVWPGYVLFAYGEARQLTFADVGAVGLLVPLLAVGAIWLWYRRPALGFPALWVFLTLAPTSSVVPIATEAGAARRMYLPLVGIVVLFVIALVTLTGRVRRRQTVRASLLPVAIASLIVVVFTAITAAQSSAFASAERLWRESAERWPSALAHRNLAAVLLQEGRRAEGIEELRVAADLKPLARYSLGVQLFDAGRSAEAIVQLRRAISEFPNDRTIALEGRRVLARALQKEGRHREAADVFGEIAAITPDDERARVSRADELAAAGDLNAAHREYQAILAAHPDHVGALTNDGLTLLQLGRPADALVLLRATVERQPDNVAALMNLASASAAAGRPADAVIALCRAVAIQPESPAPRQFLADLRTAAAAARLALPQCGPL